jgi:hypothetical protein
MEYIIAGRFEHQEQVTQAIDGLRQAHLEPGAVASFYLTPPRESSGQAAQHADHTGPNTEKTESGGVKGIATGAVVGAAAGAAGIPVLGPLAPALGALAGAYGGSLAGGLSEIKKTPKDGDPQVDANPPRVAGLMVAVGVHGSGQEQAVIAILRELGAQDIERGEGRVVDGRWQDFDPLLPMQRIPPA